MPFFKIVGDGGYAHTKTPCEGYEAIVQGVPRLF